MKKQWIALLTGCVLVCSMLAGCGSKPQTSAPAAAGSDKGCTDEAILSQLKNDGTPEFVLDGTYYTLPLETSQLIQAGWSLETEEYDAAEVSLQPGERIYGELSKDDQEIDVAIVNAGTEPCKPAEGGTVVELEYSADKDQPNPDFFVTLNGINCAMSNAALQKALEGVDGYKLNSAGNIDINRTVDDDEIAVYKVILDDDYTAITLASDNVFEYKDYQPQEVKEQASNEKIAAYKDTTKAEMEPYAQDFNAIIEGYEENMVVGFYSDSKDNNDDNALIQGTWEIDTGSGAGYKFVDDKFMWLKSIENVNDNYWYGDVEYYNGAEAMEIAGLTEEELKSSLPGLKPENIFVTKLDPEKIITDGEDKTATNMNDQTLWTRLWLIEENEDSVAAVVFDLETFSMESYTKVK